MQKDLICPYCQDPLLYTTSKGFGVAKCSCDLYPIIEGVIFLQKNDRQTNKVLVSLLKQKKRFTAVWTALSESSKTHRVVTFSFYVISKILGVRLPFPLLLLALRILGPSRSWFGYLDKRNKSYDFNLALKLLSETKEKEVVVDIGCGTGLFIKGIYAATYPKYPTIVGIDKNFLTLFMASLFLNKKALLVCSNIENGLPIANSAVDRILFLDSFAWILGKTKALNDSGRVLKKNGHVYIINIFPSTPKTKFWGYGITPRKLRLLLRNNFNKIAYAKNSSDPKDPGYSIWAQKK